MGFAWPLSRSAGGASSSIAPFLWRVERNQALEPFGFGYAAVNRTDLPLCTKSNQDP